MKETKVTQKKDIKSKDKNKLKEPLESSIDDKDAISESVDVVKSTKTTSKVVKTKDTPVETIFTKSEEKSKKRKSKDSKQKEINFEDAISELSVARYNEDEALGLETVSKTKPSSEITTSGDSMAKRKMSRIMVTHQPKFPGVFFFKSRTAFRKTNKIVSIQNGKLILR